MPVNNQKSTNAMLNAAWSGYKAAQKGEAKAAKKAEAAETVDVHTKPAKALPKAPNVHKKAGKVHTTAKKPAAKKAGRGGRK